MDQQCTKALRFLGESLWRRRVDLHGELRLGLRAVHVCVGRGIDDESRSHLADSRDDLIRVCQIERCMIEGDYLPERRKAPFELPADLPGFSGQQNLH